MTTSYPKEGQPVNDGQAVSKAGLSSGLSIRPRGLFARCSVGTESWKL